MKGFFKSADRCTSNQTAATTDLKRILCTFCDWDDFHYSWTEVALT